MTVRALGDWALVARGEVVLDVTVVVVHPRSLPEKERAPKYAVKTSANRKAATWMPDATRMAPAWIPTGGFSETSKPRNLETSPAAGASDTGLVRFESP